MKIQFSRGSVDPPVTTCRDHPHFYRAIKPSQEIRDEHNTASKNAYKNKRLITSIILHKSSKPIDTI
jgi:hypothetical protein